VKNLRNLWWAFCLAAACSAPPERPSGPGWIEANWTGADTGKMAAPMTAEWCDVRRALEIRGVAGDTGLGLMLYPIDTIDADSYRIVLPEEAEALPPAAAIALRVFSSNTIQGYQGDSGTVALERGKDGELSGVIEARARSVVNGQLLTLTGKVRDLTIVAQKRGCRSEVPADSADTNAEHSSADVD
jgi:hypothetical protein